MPRAAVVFLALFVASSAALAQTPWRKGATEWSVISGGGPAITGGVRDRGFWLLGGRWGRQFIGGDSAHLQFAVEAIPLYLQFQSTTVYGAGISQLGRLNFTRGKLVPFIEFGGGILGTTEQVPEGTARFNFTPQAGIGITHLTSERRSWTLGIRYHHTSNAGLATRNPGINAVMVHAALSWWR